MLKIMYARISDNVLDVDDWGIVKLVIADGVVTAQLPFRRGCYSLPMFVGWTAEDLARWTRYDTTGQHPEEYHDLAPSIGGVPGAFHAFWTAEEIESC